MVLLDFIDEKFLLLIIFFIKKEKVESFFIGV